MAIQAIGAQAQQPPRKSDSSQELQRLQVQRDTLVKQLEQLKNGKTDKAGAQPEMDALEKQLAKIDQQIQELQQSARSKPTVSKADSPAQKQRQDMYVKASNSAQKEAFGVYRVERDSKGNRTIVFNQAQEEKAKKTNAEDKQRFTQTAVMFA